MFNPFVCTLQLSILSNVHIPSTKVEVELQVSHLVGVLLSANKQLVIALAQADRSAFGRKPGSHTLHLVPVPFAVSSTPP